MKNLIKILIGVAILSNITIATTQDVIINLKVIKAVLISTTPMEFGTYILGDVGELKATSTITVRDITNVPDKTVIIEVDESTTLRSDNESVLVGLSLSKTNLESDKTFDTTILTGIIADGAITAVGNYIGTAKVTVKYN